MQKLEKSDTYWAWLGKGFKYLSPKRWKRAPIVEFILATLLFWVGVLIVFRFGIYWTLAIIIPAIFFLVSYNLWKIWTGKEE